MKTIIRLITFMILTSIAASAVSLETSPPLGQRQPRELQSETRNKSNVNSRSTKTITNELLTLEANSINSNPEYSSSNAGGKKNTDLNSWRNDPIACYTFWLMIFTGVLAISTIGLWIVTKKSADQVRKSVDLAGKELILTQRPKLRVSAVVISEPMFEKDQHVRGQFYVRNIGGTLATITDIGCWVVPRNIILPMKRPYEGKPGNITDKPALSPGEPYTITFASEKPLDVNGSAIMKGEGGLVLYVMGWIEYMDDLKIKRRLDFCRRYDATMGRFLAVEDPDYESKEQ